MTKTIVVISGKGGTGKTSITASMACLASGAVIADCDVDAPDLHLILKPEVIEEGRFMSGLIASIDRDLCTECGECRRACAFGAIGEELSVDPIACEGCAVCDLVCPAGAVRLETADCGQWFLSKTRAGLMSHARLDPGKENSGRLVSLVRTKAKEEAERTGSELIIVDGPPGIGCSVIASMAGCDMALVVTEPTLSGVSDMQRVLDLALHFKIPAAVAINKYDINVDIAGEIEAMLAERGVHFAGMVPYDTSFTEAQLAGKSVVEYGGDGAAPHVERLCKAVLKQLMNA